MKVILLKGEVWIQNALINVPFMKRLYNEVKKDDEVAFVFLLQIVQGYHKLVTENEATKIA